MSGVSLMQSFLPIVGVDEVDIATANQLLVGWGHPLGACRRPYEQRAHVMLVDSDPVAVTVHACPVSPTVDGEPRRGVVELARIARHPAQPWVLRPMLRIWRAVLAHRWSTWPVDTAISYAMPGTPGDLYRFDGWERVGPCRPARVGATSSWSKGSAADRIADGVKTLWRYRYDPIQEEGAT